MVLYSKIRLHESKKKRQNETIHSFHFSHIFIVPEVRGSAKNRSKKKTLYASAWDLPPKVCGIKYFRKN